MKRAGSISLILVLILILFGQNEAIPVQAQSGISVDPVSKTVENPYIKISWDSSIAERVSGLYLKGFDPTYNLVGNHIGEFTGNAYYYSNNGVLGIVGSDNLNSTWEYTSTSQWVKINITSTSAYDGIFVTTEYTIPADSPAIWVKRTFGFGAKAITISMLAPYVLRAYDRLNFTTFAYPRTDGSIMSRTDTCEGGCADGLWDQSWIDIEAPVWNVGLGLVNLSGNPSSFAWVDRDAYSATSYTYAALPASTYDQDMTLSYVLYPHLGNYQSVDWEAISIPAPQSCEPTDLGWSDQWDMKAINLVGALNQFPNCSPNPVTIAVIDSGVDLDHPDLEGNIYDSEQNYGLTSEDLHGHGTHVIGIIGAVQNNSLGISGIHPNPRILSYKYTEFWSIELTLKDDATRIAELIRLAVDNGAKVINISSSADYDKKAGKVTKHLLFQNCYPHKDGCVGIMGEAIRYAQENNVVIVAPSGNDGKDGYQYPAAYSSMFNNVIAVAASTNENTLAEYSTTGSWVNVSAPGGEGRFIPSLKDFECLFGIDDCVVSLGLNGTYNAEMAGTSQASPHVAGVVALIISANPQLTPVQIREIISTEVSPWAVSPIRPAGNGILNAEAAVKAALP